MPHHICCTWWLYTDPFFQVIGLVSVARKLLLPFSFHILFWINRPLTPVTPESWWRACLTAARKGWRGWTPMPGHPSLWEWEDTYQPHTAPCLQLGQKRGEKGADWYFDVDIVHQNLYLWRRHLPESAFLTLAWISNKIILTSLSGESDARVFHKSINCATNDNIQVHLGARIVEIQEPSVFIKHRPQSATHSKYFSDQ